MLGCGSQDIGRFTTSLGVAIDFLAGWRAPPSLSDFRGAPWPRAWAELV